MKKTWFLILGVSMLACQSSESSKDGVKLSGNLEEFSKGTKVFVERVAESGIMVLDTLNVDANGDFETYVSVKEPAFYRLNIDGRQIITLILTGQETEVEVNAQGNDPRGFYEVSGSLDTEYKNQMDVIMTQYRNQIQKMQQEQYQARAQGDAQVYQSKQIQMMELARKTQERLKRLIREASPSLAAFYGIQMIDATQNFAFIDTIAAELQTEIPENFHVKGLLSQMEVKKSLSIGKMAPEISLPNPQGEIITLSSLRGKYVLIDFWAAWCGPCRRENPNVIKAYNKYAGPDFEILGVSLDRNKEKWLAAIDQDGLPWLHVSDLKYFRSQAAQDYQINAIPATYLIDPEGKIIAKNLRGANLEAKLKEIFGH